MSNVPHETDRTPSAPPSSRSASERGSRRRALGTSVLAAWRALGPLLLRDAAALPRAVVEDALQKLDEVRAALRALRDGSTGGSSGGSSDGSKEDE